MSGLAPGDVVFVRGQGTAKVVTSGKRLSVLSLSSRNTIDVAAVDVRPLISRANAEALVKLLERPLELAKSTITPAEALQLANRSLEVEPMVTAFRALSATGSSEPEVLTALVMLEAAFGGELAAALGITRSVLATRIVREPSRKRVKQDLSWFDALIDGKVIAKRSRPIDHAVRAVEISQKNAWTCWRAAYDALEPLRMYPVIVDELPEQPNEELKALEKQLRSGFVSKGTWPETVRIGITRPLLVIVPFRAPWLSAAYLRFGAFNSCPPPEQHARTLRTFHDDWGAFPIAFDRSSVELVVRAPPTDAASLRRATKAHLAYCDELGVETKARREQHAASRHWSFWWD